MKHSPPPPAPDKDTGADDDGYVSKSRLKQQMHELQALGKTLADLKPAKRDTLPLSATLLEAIDEYHRIRSHEAKRRQLQFIGKVMRSENTEAIQQALHRLDSQHLAHQAETWRERLLDPATEQEACGQLAELAEELDFQHLRNLVRNARKEASRIAELLAQSPDAARPPSPQGKKLLAYLKQVMVSIKPVAN